MGMGINACYHLCYTSHDEVLCRSWDDYERLISKIGYFAFKFDSKVLAYCVMSNHVHLILLTDCVEKFVQHLRGSYTKSFNYKYLRKGELGESGYFCIRLSGLRHMLAAISYVLRNPVHHKVSLNPFNYPFSSVSLYYKPRSAFVKSENSHYGGDGGNMKKSVGSMKRSVGSPHDDIRRRRMVNRRYEFPSDVVFLKNGAMDPCCFVDTGLVEYYFGSYSAFDYNLARNDYDRWEEEQKRENQGVEAISLRNIEPFLSDSYIEVYEGLARRRYEESALSDVEICGIVDGYYVRKFKKASYVELTMEEREFVVGDMCARYEVSREQMERCVGIKKKKG